MDGDPIDAEKTAKREKAERTMRTVWSILTPVFVLIVLFELYEWSRGEESSRRILSPLGMICLGLAGIFGARNKTLRTVFVATALVLVVAGLVTMFIY